LETKTVGQFTTDIHPNEQWQRKQNPLQTWLNELEKYECNNCPIDYKRIDNNGFYSYGCLQFQKQTFLENLKKFYPETYKSIEKEEWQNLIWDCQFQKKLAYKMLEANSGAWRNWARSVSRGLDKPISTGERD